VILNHLTSLLSLNLLVDIDLDDVVDHDEATYDNSLSYLDSIDASVDVDSICAENGDVTHVNIVQKSQIN